MSLTEEKKGGRCDWLTYQLTRAENVRGDKETERKLLGELKEDEAGRIYYWEFAAIQVYQ
jgi:hypothetical protein